VEIITALEGALLQQFAHSFAARRVVGVHLIDWQWFCLRVARRAALRFTTIALILQKQFVDFTGGVFPLCAEQ
jgi:hypothetical protein